MFGDLVKFGDLFYSTYTDDKFKLSKLPLNLIKQIFVQWFYSSKIILCIT